MPPPEEALTLGAAVDAAEAPEIWSVRLSALGAVISVPAVAALLIPSIEARSAAHVLSFALYGFGLISMFSAAAWFHAQAGRERTFTKCLDYGAIGLMIAGNFTPYCLIALGTPYAQKVLGVVWALALAALILRVTRPALSKWIFVALFMGMGWVSVFIALPLWRALGPAACGLTLLGGAIYTVGTLFFNRYEGDVEPPGFGPHDVWHVFILVAAATHYAVLLGWMTPR